MLEVFLDHRFEVVRRRSQFRRNKKADRLHLVDGLLIALLDIDEVIQVIRTSDDAGTARERLKTVFELSEAQAEYILEMQLRRLTRFSRIELEKEQEELRREIEELDAILDDETLRWKVVSDELAEVAEDLRHAAPYGAAGVGRHRGHLAGRAARGGRRPVLRVPVLQRACWPARAPTRPSAAGGARDQPRRRGLGGAHHRARRGRRGHLARAGCSSSPCSTCRRSPSSANDPNLQGGVPLSEVLSLETGERALALCRAARRRARPRRSAPGRASSSGCNPEVLGTRRVGRHRAAGRRRGRRRARAGHRHARRSASSPPTPSCCTSAPTPSARRAAPAAASPASGSPPASASPGSARSTPPTRSW